MNKRKIIIGVVVVVAIVVFVGLAMKQRRGGGTEVRVERVQHRDLVSVVTASGRIRPRRSVDIQADVSGRIVSLRVEEGQMVARNDTLLIIDPTTFQAALQRAQAALATAEAQAAQAKANRDQARRSLDRTRSIRTQNPNLISEQELETAETNFDVQEALYQAAVHGVEQARANLREARDRLAKTTILAPMTGRVTRLNVEEGETAIVGTMNNPGTVLLTVADLSEMEAFVEVDETDVPKIEVGDSATIEIDAFPEQVFTGHVTEIAHSSIQGGALGLSGSTANQAVDFEVVIRLDDPPPSLRTDLSATADVIAAVRDSVLSIPIIALTLRKPEDSKEEERPADRAEEDIPLAAENSGAEADEEEGVFVVGEDNTITFRPVKIGIAGREHFEVLEGLQQGEIIVAGSYQAIRRLNPGDLVKPTNRDALGGQQSARAR